MLVDHILRRLIFKHPLPPRSTEEFKMDALVNDFQPKDDDSIYENMVDELYNPVNYAFSGGDVRKSDCVDKLTTNSHIVIPNIESTKAAHTKSKELGLFNLFLPMYYVNAS